MVLRAIFKMEFYFNHLVGVKYYYFQCPETQWEHYLANSSLNFCFQNPKISSYPPQDKW